MADPVSLLYLTHDLADPTTRKRAAMLRDGGAKVTVAGFCRAVKPPSIEGCTVISLGRTHNGRFLHRAFSVIREVLLLDGRRGMVEAADVILARNLEMLAIGVRARRLSARRPALVYEALDIHRLLLRADALGEALRALEGWLSRRAALLVTSSPAFVREYFESASRVLLPVRLVENKVYPAPAVTPVLRPEGPPWRIGWFGAIRCRKSLHLLAELTRLRPGVEVDIRGRVAEDAIPDFGAVLAAAPGLRFHGPYRNPEDLAEIYGKVHFIWAIDRFEEGLNSSWLLPNRLYEGCLHGAVPLAEQEVETGRFLSAMGLGLTLPAFAAAAAAALLDGMTPERYRALASAVAAVPPSRWAYTAQDCRDLVAALKDAA